MSVKRIIVVIIAAVGLAAFIGFGINDAVKRNDKLQFQQIQLKSKSMEIQQLNSKFDKLNDDLKKAQDDKNTSQEEIDKLKQQQNDLEKQKEDLESQLQAKLDEKNRIATASAKVANAATGTTTVSAATYSGGSIEAIIKNAAVKYGLDPDWFYGLAKCESTWNPNAINYNYTDPGTGTHPAGLFQHVMGYWPARAAQYGYAGASVFDPEANANVTAAMWKTGSHLWECQ